MGKQHTHTYHQKKTTSQKYRKFRAPSLFCFKLLSQTQKYRVLWKTLLCFRMVGGLFYWQKIGFKGFGVNLGFSMGGCSKIGADYGSWLSTLQCWLRIGQSILAVTMLGSVLAGLFSVLAMLSSVIEMLGSVLRVHWSIIECSIFAVVFPHC